MRGADFGVRRRRTLAGVVTGVVLISVAAVGQAASGADVFFDQMGRDIDGDGPGDGAAVTAMSAAGDRVAVGAPEYYDNGDAAGHVRVFDWNGVGWRQIGADIDGEAAGDFSGVAVAMSADGDRMAVGAPGNDGGGDAAGHVRIFDWDGSRWTQVGGDLDGDGARDGAGTWVALSADGSRVAMGATGDQGTGRAGYVRIFDWDGGEWSQVGMDITNDVAALSWASDVALTADGDRVAIGSNSLAGGGEGHVRVFDWDGAQWSQTGGDITVEPRPAQFGRTVALSGTGDRVAIGAYGEPDSGPRGGVWVFDLVGGSWTMVDNQGVGTPVLAVALSADGRRLSYSGPGTYFDPGLGRTVIRDETAEGWTDVGEIRADDLADAAESVVLSAAGDRVAIGSSHHHGTGNYTGTQAGQVRVFDLSATPPPALGSPVAVVPARLLETRSGYETIDGVSEGIGRRSAGSTTRVQVTGRGGVPAGASEVIVNVAAVAADGPGFLTVYPCGAPRPDASSVNYAAGQTIANSVFTGVGPGGKVCIYNLTGVDLVADVAGYTPARSGLRSTVPARLLDSRSGQVDIGYEDWVEIDRIAPNSVTELWVTSRGGVPLEASAVMLNVAAVSADAPGFLTVYPCGERRPDASSVNYAAGQTIANSVFTGVGARHRVCIYSLVGVDLVADVTGYTPAGGAGLWSLVPARLLETRPGNKTVDGVSAGIGRRPAGSVTAVKVTGRGGVPAGASAVRLNVAAVSADGPGFLTVYPCGGPRPDASNVNYAAGQTIANSVFTGVGAGGKVCIYNLTGVDLVVDVTGHT